MKIAASIYSSQNLSLTELVRELEALHIDFLHVDCFSSDIQKVDSDLQMLQSISSTPIDFHAIGSEVASFFDLAVKHQMAQITFQLEELQGDWQVPTNFKGKVGISITSNTELSAIQPYAKDVDFILLMTTQPGVSGGKFDKRSFQKIHEARKMFPKLSIHVDGGINAEVSFILRLLGVDSAVSGSFLVNHENLAFALSELRFHTTASFYSVGDFMMEKEALPILDVASCNFQQAVQTMDSFGLGFVLFQKNNQLFGVCSHADLRKGLLQNLNDLNNITVLDIINHTPVTIHQNATTSDMLDLIKSKSFPILFLPVLNQNRSIAGAVLFNQLIKGEG